MLRRLRLALPAVLLLVAVVAPPPTASADDCNSCNNMAGIGKDWILCYANSMEVMFVVSGPTCACLGGNQVTAKGIGPGGPSDLVPSQDGGCEDYGAAKAQRYYCTHHDPDCLPTNTLSIQLTVTNPNAFCGTPKHNTQSCVCY